MAAKFSKREEDNLAKIFAMFDKNSDGEISTEELIQAMRAAGKSQPKEELEQALKRVDGDGNGSVGYQEFIDMMWRHMKSGLTEEEIKKAFQVMDLNEDGEITKEELLEVANKNGCEISKEQVDSIFNETDLDGDGKIDMDECRNVLSS